MPRFIQPLNQPSQTRNDNISSLSLSGGEGGRGRRERVHLRAPRLQPRRDELHHEPARTQHRRTKGNNNTMCMSYSVT